MFNFVWHGAAVRDFLTLWLTVAGFVAVFLLMVLALIWLVAAAPTWLFILGMFIIVVTAFSVLIWTA